MSGVLAGDANMAPLVKKAAVRVVALVWIAIVLLLFC